MKKLLFTCLLLFPLLSFCQSHGSLTIFSENGDKFYLFLDGVKQNDAASAKIRVDDLTDLYYSAKIVFQDAGIAPLIRSNLYISDGEDVMRDASYRIKREKNSKAKLGFYSMLPYQPNFTPTPGMQLHHFGEPGITKTAEAVPIMDTIVSKGSSLGNLSFFSQNGDKFFLFLNGIKQNEVPQAMLRIKDVPGLYYNAKIVFKDSRLAPIVKNNLFVSDGDDVLMDATYRIRRDNTGKPKLNFYAIKPVDPNFKPAEGTIVLNFNGLHGENPSIGTAGLNQLMSLSKGNSRKTATTTEDQRRAEKKKTGQSGDSLSKHGATPLVKNENVTPVKQASTTPLKKGSSPVAASVQSSPADAKNAAENKKCNGWPMGKADLINAKKTIEQEEREEQKLEVARNLITTNCLTTSQVAELCMLLKGEKARLDFAKYAFKFTLDRKNYTEISKILTQDKSKKELARFVAGG